MFNEVDLLRNFVSICRKYGGIFHDFNLGEIQVACRVRVLDYLYLAIEV